MKRSTAESPPRPEKPMRSAIDALQVEGQALLGAAR